MSIQIMLLLFGGILVLIAIIGGGFELRELKIPQVEKTARILAAFGGIAFVVMAIYYDSRSLGKNPAPPAFSQSNQSNQNNQPNQNNQFSEPETVAVAGDIILGTWKQYGYNTETSQWQYLGTFDVAKVNGNYIISAREQQESPTVINSLGTFDVQSDGMIWKFNSNWGNGVVANFELQRVSDTVFEGMINVEQQQQGKTKFVRIQ